MTTLERLLFLRDEIDGLIWEEERRLREPAMMDKVGDFVHCVKLIRTDQDLSLIAARDLCESVRKGTPHFFSSMGKKCREELERLGCVFR